MTIVIGLALVVLGVAIGFIVTWAFHAGATITLFVGVLLVVAGGIVGFVVEWLIDLAYRRNRELRQQLGQRRDEEVRELRGQLSATHVQLDGLRDDFEAYQRTHPDDMTVVKGIGPVYQWKLRDAGVNTYAQLAAADPDQLRRMLDIKDWQRADVESWIEQARDWAQREP
jgi:predicted flap endonuclease-1-like 5' DNA nuclease